jgi:predicted transcriptional regulator of viral defense system
MALAPTYRRRLHERALDQYGYVTTKDAEELEVPAVELRKLRQRGGLDHVAHGLYRFEDIPHTDRDQFKEAVLRVGPGAFLDGDAVLALHGLGLVNPRRIRVATTGRPPRRQLPDFIELVDRPKLEEKDITEYEGIKTVTVARALLTCRGLVMQDRLLEALREAVDQGLVRRSEKDELARELAGGE